MPSSLPWSASSVVDSILFRDAFGTAQARALFSDRGLVQRYIESARSSVYVPLVRPRGGPGSNWVLLVRTNIAVNANPWALIAPDNGGVGRHWPTAVPPLNGS